MDGRAIAGFVAKTTLFDNERVFLIGRSLGGAVALHLLAENPRVF
jgi:predicted alpha/beta superfamily hydrolase